MNKPNGWHERQQQHCRDAIEQCNKPVTADDLREAERRLAAYKALQGSHRQIDLLPVAFSGGKV